MSAYITRLGAGMGVHFKGLSTGIGVRLVGFWVNARQFFSECFNCFIDQYFDNRFISAFCN